MAQRILIITVEPLWPRTHGGRVRTARIAETLADHGSEVRVVFPDRPGCQKDSSPPGIEQYELPWSAPSSLFHRLRLLPWLGLYSSARVRDVQEQIDHFEPDFIYWSHSYLAAVGIKRLSTDALQIVEFANIERERFLSISQNGNWRHRLSARLEYIKASLWERKVVRQADLCVAISEADEQTLLMLGGNAVKVENALPSPRNQPAVSPDNAVVMSVANWMYGPNRDGLNLFLKSSWPEIVKAIPAAKLVLAGNGSDIVSGEFGHLKNIQSVGYVDDLADLFAESALFLAPARTGAGRQLKVAEALGHARVVVGPPFLNRECRIGLPSGALIGSNDVAGEIVKKIRNRKERHLLEIEIAEYAAKHDWQFETASLRQWMNSKAN